jgi:hypothetical protein
MQIAKTKKEIGNKIRKHRKRELNKKRGGNIKAKVYQNKSNFANRN